MSGPPYGHNVGEQAQQHMQAMASRPQSQGHINGSNGDVANGVSRQGAPRISIRDALPFSPFSSVVPFSTDVLPLPATPVPTNIRLLVSEDERERAHYLISGLEKSASEAQQTSERLGSTLNTLRDLLHPDNLSAFNFKAPTMPLLSGHKPNLQRAVPELSSFAKLVLEHTKVAYRADVPVATAKIQSKKLRVSQSTPSKSSITKARPLQAEPSVQVSPQVSTQTPSHKRIEVIIPTTKNKPTQDELSQGQKTAVSNHTGVPDTIAQNQQNYIVNQQLTQPKVVFPQVIVQPLAPEKKAEYVTYVDDPSSHKRKREEESTLVDLNVDQRHKSAAVLRALNDFSTELLRAADHFEPDCDDGTGYFVAGETAPNERPILSRDARSRLDKSITSAVSSSCFSELPAETVARLQRLCEGTVTAAQAYSLKLDDNPSEIDIEEWRQRVDLTEGGLQAARILLRTMNAGREEKQLYSEDLLTAVVMTLEHVIDGVIIPVVESRSSGPTADVFKSFSVNKKPLTSLIQMLGKVLRSFGDLASQVEIADTAIGKIEYIALRLIYVENAHTEKDACLGVQRFETVRHVAMDALAKVFGRYPVRRDSIFDEILSSLEKLPVTRQSARQYKAVDGKPIQLVSALLMRLVQTSATLSTSDGTVARFKDKQANGNATESADEASEDESDYSDNHGDGPHKPEKRSKADRGDNITGSLRDVVDPLTAAAWKAAYYVANFLVQRALRSTKTGDEPYRNLLDMFTEDFLNVLGSPDWPGAEILLRALTLSCLQITGDDKQPVPARNTALDLMGVMGSGISELKTRARNAAAGVYHEQPDVYQNLARQVDQLLSDSINEEAVLSNSGPFSAVIVHLRSRGSNDAQSQSAKGLFAALWTKASLEWAARDSSVELQDSFINELESWITEPNFSPMHEWDGLTPQHAKLAASIVTLYSSFSRMQPRMFTTILTFMTSQQPTLRNRSLKSALQLIEKEPDLIDKHVFTLTQIIRCLDDNSSLVRDSALSFLARLFVLKPTLQKQAYPRVVHAVGDEAASVRKRAIKILKDLYLREDDHDNKAAIAGGLVSRVGDEEDAVAELARQTIAEIWMSPYHLLEEKKDKVALQLALQEQALVIVKIAQKGETHLAALETLLKHLLSDEHPNSQANSKVCKDIVSAIFDGILDNDDSPGKPSQQTLASVMKVFAQVKPKLFSKDQVKLLEAYIKNLTPQNLPIFRSVVTVFRHVFPVLSTSLGRDFLLAVEGSLKKQISRIPKPELPETAACLWIIAEILESQSALASMIKSVLVQLRNRKSAELDKPGNEKAREEVRRYLQLAGPFGKACDFDTHADAFKAAFPDWKGPSVSGLIIDVIHHFTRLYYPSILRQTALESIGMICQAWPQNFVRPDVCKVFEQVFEKEDIGQQAIVMHAFREFLASEERRSESGATIKVGEGAVHGKERLTKTYMPTDNDGATTTIAQRFLPQIVRIAMKADDDSALAATRIIASINRQGLVHPKECGPPLVALETSPNSVVATLAFEEHKRLHQKHETMFEKEYMRAIRQSYEYQRDVFKDPRGIILQPPRPKLTSLFEVLKTGTSKIRKRFLTGMCNRVDFDLAAFEVDQDDNTPDAILYARYILENLALLDYTRLDEILATVTELEKLVIAGTGTAIAHAVDLDILKVRLQAPSGSQPHFTEQTNGEVPHDFTLPDLPISADDIVSPVRLRQLTAAAMIMLLAWETRTYLRQLWGLQKHGKSTTKLSAKDANKAPTRQPFVGSEKYLEKTGSIMAALATSDSQTELCRSFATLMSVDHELKIGEGEDDVEADEDAEGEDAGGASDATGTPSKGRKRKGTGSVAGTPSAKRFKNAVRGRPSLKRAGSSVRRGRAGSSVSVDEDGDYFG